MELAGRYVEYLETLARHWSSGKAATLLNADLIAYLQPRLHRCSSPLKIRVVLSLLYLDEATRRVARENLLKILTETEVDNDEWVRKLSRLISSFITTGTIDIRDTDSESAFSILKHLGSRSSIEDYFKAPLDQADLINVLNEFIFTHTEVLDNDEWWTNMPESSFGNCYFKAKVTWKDYFDQVTRKGDVVIRRIINIRGKEHSF